MSVFHGGPSPVDKLDIWRVSVTNWTLNGIDISRADKAGFLRGVTIMYTNATANPGSAGLQASSGNGISLQGVQGALLLRCNATGNGANSSHDYSPPMGWVRGVLARGAAVSRTRQAASRTTWAVVPRCRAPCSPRGCSSAPGFCLLSSHLAS